MPDKDKGAGRHRYKSTQEPYLHHEAESSWPKRGESSGRDDAGDQGAQDQASKGRRGESSQSPERQGKRGEA
jgi:hypothetical protein